MSVLAGELTASKMAEARAGDATLSAANAAKTDRIGGVHTLRAFAALAVALGHAMIVVDKINNGQGGTLSLFNPSIPTGAGVDLFFIISGFVMVYASQSLFGKSGAASEFLYRRVTRIVPIYWGATFVFLALLAINAMRGGEFPSLGALLSSLFFIPSTEFKPVGDLPYPVLSNGWTLNYEMFFYAIFAAFLFLQRRLATLCVALVMVSLVCAVSLFQPDNVLLQFWGRAISLEFVIGIAIATARIHGLRLPGWLSLALLAGAGAWLLAVSNLPFPESSPYGFVRLLYWGTPAMMIMAAVALSPKSLPKSGERFLNPLGDASYIFYLIHPIIFVVFQHSGLYVPQTALSAWLCIGGMLIVSGAVSIGLNQYIEQPLLSFLHRRQPQNALHAARDAKSHPDNEA